MIFTKINKFSTKVSVGEISITRKTKETIGKVRREERKYINASYQYGDLYIRKESINIIIH